jgi:poly-gamma-glutamate synthesis protein (capsule biosynthesis protein)
MRGRRSAIWLVLCAAIIVGVIAATVASDDDRGRAGPTNSESTVPSTADLLGSTSTPASGSGAVPTTTAPTTTTRSPLGSGASVTIAFGGDVHFEDEVRDQLDRRGTAMLDAIAPTLGGADVTIVNLETAITERGDPVPKAYNFRAPARALDALGAAGVDVVSMANNHGLDYGDEGFADSLAAEHGQGVAIIGIGNNAAEAYAPFVTEVRGQRIAIIAATQVLDDSLIADWTATDDHRGLASAKEVERLTAAVASARATADTVVVFLHWGTEKAQCPQDRQTTLATQLVDAGADIIVGGHAHRLQGAGRLGGAFVGYGLGNFVWYADGGDSATTGVLTVAITGRRVDSSSWSPARIRDGVPVPLVGDEATRAEAKWQALRDCTNLTP